MGDLVLEIVTVDEVCYIISFIFQRIYYYYYKCTLSPICGLRARVRRTKSGSSVDIFHYYLRYFKWMLFKSVKTKP